MSSPINAGRLSVMGEDVTASPPAQLTGDAAAPETLPSALTAAELIELVAQAKLKEQLSLHARSAFLITAVHDVATFATRCTAGLLLQNGSVGQSLQSPEQSGDRYQQL